MRKHEAYWPSGTAVFAENVTIEDTFARSGRAALREKARRLVAEAKATKAPRLYAHIFSNGGSMLLLEVLSELEPLRLDGVIYDSAPSAEGTIRPVAGPVIAYLSGGTLQAARGGLVDAVAGASGVSRAEGAPRVLRRSLDASINVPRRELFLYSDGDRLVWRSHVEQFRAPPRPGKRVVETRNFGASPHVGHFMRNPRRIADSAQWVGAGAK